MKSKCLKCFITLISGTFLLDCFEKDSRHFLNYAFFAVIEFGLIFLSFHLLSNFQPWMQKKKLTQSLKRVQSPTAVFMYGSSAIVLPLSSCRCRVAAVVLDAVGLPLSRCLAAVALPLLLATVGFLLPMLSTCVLPLLLHFKNWIEIKKKNLLQWRILSSSQ